MTTSSSSGSIPTFSDTAVWIVWVTCPTEAVAHQLAQGLVTHRLVACAQVGAPITSYYRWEQALQQDTEWPLVLKTTASRFEDLQQWLTTHHPYTVPQVVAVSAAASLPAYAQWVVEQTTPRQQLDGGTDPATV